MAGDAMATAPLVLRRFAQQRGAGPSVGAGAVDAGGVAKNVCV
jgi:hypothetical protein